MVEMAGLLTLEDDDEVMVIDASVLLPGSDGKTRIGLLVTLGTGEWLVHDYTWDDVGHVARVMFQIRTGTPILLDEWTDISEIRDRTVLDRSRTQEVSPADLDRLDS